ncbi:hypothetical protein IE4771_PA00090 (plasmid) [Rhizobium etli bv. mimosae str. IE4771]|uniref:Uncharacterized protein n=1 Tax=Rhizobium etli bv. mimosae str. IE4771 TaxID=1432050 RepID=A0A060ID36_RHIET|nr:hypothetical protein IE4771_PA00090 [Rhizobium sp. IE4771]
MLAVDAPGAISLAHYRFLAIFRTRRIGRAAYGIRASRPPSDAAGDDRSATCGKCKMRHALT